MTLDEVKRIPMREVVERYGFRPSRAGFIHCPFHQGDKGASLKVYERDWHCHACNAHGDQVDFVRRMDNLTFKEAFIALGGTYGDTDREEVKRKIRLAEIERKKKVEREAEMRRKREKNNRYITALRNGLISFPVFSDEWCFCQDELPRQLYLHEILSEGGDQVGAT